MLGLSKYQSYKIYQLGGALVSDWLAIESLAKRIIKPNMGQFQDLSLMMMCFYFCHPYDIPRCSMVLEYLPIYIPIYIYTFG